MAVEYFCAYHSYLDALEPLTDAERGRLFVACLKYSKSGEAEHLSGNERFVFPVFRGQIDRDNAKYANKCKKQADNANMRWNKDDANDAMAYDGIPDVPPHREDANNAKEKEKEKEKAKTTENIEPPTEGCAELPSSSTPPAITLPLADGSEHPIPRSLVTDLSGLYPAVDVMQQLRNMRGWLLSNPKNRKTKTGIMRFVTSWLAREQNSARPVGGASGGKPTKAQELNEFYGMAAKWANEEGTA